MRPGWLGPPSNCAPQELCLGEARPALSVLLAALQKACSGPPLGSPREGRGAVKAAVGSKRGCPPFPVHLPRGRFLGLAQRNWKNGEVCGLRLAGGSAGSRPP